MLKEETTMSEDCGWAIRSVLGPADMLHQTPKQAERHGHESRGSIRTLQRYDELYSLQSLARKHGGMLDHLDLR